LQRTWNKLFSLPKQDYSFLEIDTASTEAWTKVLNLILVKQITKAKVTKLKSEKVLIKIVDSKEKSVFPIIPRNMVFLPFRFHICSYKYQFLSKLVGTIVLLVVICIPIGMFLDSLMH